MEHVAASDPFPSEERVSRPAVLLDESKPMGPVAEFFSTRLQVNHASMCLDIVRVPQLTHTLNISIWICDNYVCAL